MELQGTDSAALWIGSFNKLIYDLLWPTDSLQLLQSQVESHFNDKSDWQWLMMSLLL